MKIDLNNYKPSLKSINSKPYIFDLFRKKYIRFTKEEWVRQCILDHLMNQLSYSRGLIRTEFQISMERRVDIAIFNNKMEIEVLIECKSPECILSPYSLEQLHGYNNILRAKRVILTNGISTFIWDRGEDNRYEFIQTP